MGIVWDEVSLPIWWGVFFFSIVFPYTPIWKLVTSPNQRRLFNSHKRLYYVLILLINGILLMEFLHTTHGYDIDYMLLSVVHTLAFILRKIDDVLTTLLWIFFLYAIWKLKDRIFLVVGIENASQVIGDYRDWLTCWGMYRFQPLEIYLWKIEGIDVSKDLFFEVTMGYNLGHRTRVRQHASELPGAVGRHGNPDHGRYQLEVKEALQINWDCYDVTEVMTIELKQQGLYHSECVSKCQIGCQALNDMIAKERQYAASNPVTNTMVQYNKTGAVSHNTTKLMFDSGETDHCWQKVNLIPQGVLWLRVLPFTETVAGQEDAFGDFDQP